ncbi:hypothetical protein BT96DRAFT_927118 [Gymnopus androsaceus JB14]|uniref:Uncharacterized protein n=1 Tax=Gymnopus androsaceus JB14 TaxID=1447944 RepID=A0A6A4GRK0_9AGAR|nr:hypothetical protein BT96DRAFT_927118 [Gymnopus androsaceus JB14]
MEHTNASATSTGPTPQTPTTTFIATPSTPTQAPSKVKMSLKDFAMRKRRQKEEEQQREKEEREREEQKKDVSAEELELKDGDGKEEGTSRAEVMKELMEEDTTMHAASHIFPVSVAPAEQQAEDCERRQSQSDVDVIMKASEMLNKLMVTSKAVGTTTSKMVNGLNEHPSFSALPTFSPATVLSPSPTIFSQTLLPGLSPFAPSSSQIAQDTSPKESPQVSSERASKHVRRASHEDGEIVDNDDQTSSPSAPPPPSSISNKQSSRSSSIPKSYSPPPRPFKFPDTNAANEQRSRTPPTQPRSFVSRSPSVSSLPHGSPPMRSLGLGGSGNTSILAPLTSTAASFPAISAPLTAPPAAAPPVNPALGRTPPSGPRALRQLQQRQDAGGRGYPGDRNGGGNMLLSRGAPYDSRDRDRFRDRGGDFGRDSRDRDRDRDREWSSGPQRIRARDGGGWGR